MGYRTYIGSMPKREYNKIKSLTYEQLKEYYPSRVDEDFDDETKTSLEMSPYDFAPQLYEFGKYTDFAPPKKSTLPFFKKPCVKKRYEDYDFRFVTKEFLAYIIEYYSKLVEKYYEDMMKPLYDTDLIDKAERKYDRSDGYRDYKVLNLEEATEQQKIAIYRCYEHVRSMSFEWRGRRNYSLDGNEITQSWKYEYAIFELLRIYKTFDWKKNVMVYYGY